MANEITIDLTQNEPNALTAIADAERAKLGTGTFLDVYNVNAGTIDDVVERKNEIKINKFNSSKTYPNF